MGVQTRRDIIILIVDAGIEPQFISDIGVFLRPAGNAAGAHSLANLNRGNIGLSNMTPEWSRS